MIPRRLLAVLSTFLLLAGAARAQAPEEFYKGKTLRMIVGFTPGAGTDLNARLVARYLTKYLPGRPEIVVANMVGASSLTAVQYLKNSAPKDGTVISAFSAGLITQSLTNPSGFPVDMANYSWIGSNSEDVRVCYTWYKAGIRTWSDFVHAKQVVFGETGAGSLGYIDQRMLQTIFGVHLKQVLGYPGAAEKHVAMESGELDGDCGTFGDINPSWIADKKINIVLRFTDQKLPGIPDSAPYFMDLVRDPRQRQVLQLLSAPTRMGRPYVVAKSVPPERVAVLRRAFDEAVRDPGLLAEAAKQRLTVISPMSGEDAQAAVESLYKSPPEVIAEAMMISGK